MAAITDKFLDICPHAVQDGTDPTMLAKVETVSGKNALDVNIVGFNQPSRIGRTVFKDKDVAIDPLIVSQEIVVSETDLAIPAGKIFFMRSVVVGGNNDGIFRVIHNGNVLLVIRSSAAKKTEMFDFWSQGLEYEIPAGDTFKVTVEPCGVAPNAHTGLKTALYEVTVLGFTLV